jgi:hypothetical protein
MKKTFPLLGLASLLLAVAFGLGRAGQSITYNQQMSAFGAAKDVATVVFGVMGVWIAIVYPDLLTKVIADGTDNKREQVFKLARLLRPLLVGAFVLVGYLLFALLGPLAKTIPWFITHAPLMRGTSFSVLSISVLLLIWSLVLALVPGRELQYHLQALISKRERLDRARSQVQVVDGAGPQREDKR